jgi:hypothetical protein
MWVLATFGVKSDKIEIKIPGEFIKIEHYSLLNFELK